MLPLLKRIIEAAARVQPNDLQLIPIAQRSYFLIDSRGRPGAMCCTCYR
jgi:hypothetical protein